MTNKIPDKEYWEGFFQKIPNNSHYLSKTPIEFMQNYEKEMAPFFMGGYERGFMQKTAMDMLLSSCESSNNSPQNIKILDVGSGFGDLTVYLSLKGYDVIGLDIAETSKSAGENLSKKFNANCSFVAESIEKTQFPDNYFDFIIGFGSFHHFIKYNGGSKELKRIMKKGAVGFFADPFHENPCYRLFHNKKQMIKFGDEIMTRTKIIKYFADFKVEIIPVDWFVMFDKLFLYILGSNREKHKEKLRKLSKFFFYLDRHINKKSSIALFFSGAIVTKITK